MKICCISDTHGYNIPIEEMPPADILVHSGDFSFLGRESEVINFNNWLESVKFLYSEIICIPGNHEVGIESRERRTKELLTNCHFLINEEYVYYDQEKDKYYKFFGSPNTPVFGRWAYMLTDEERSTFWECIPEDTDILITHGPPKYILDNVGVDQKGHDNHVGCPYLGERVEEVSPLLHVFGHIHEGYGVIKAASLDTPNVVSYVNCAIMDERYKPVNKPILLEI